MNVWNLFCPSCGGPKTERTKQCKGCRTLKPLIRKKRKRVSREVSGAVATEITLSDGTVILTRSKLEAAWIKALETCSPCYECLQLPIKQKGRRGDFIGTYTPDLIIDDVYLELKSDTKYAKKDSRQIRALELNPEAKFLVIGGYPHSASLYIKMVSSEGVMEYKKKKLSDVKGFLGCE